MTSEKKSEAVMSDRTPLRLAINGRYYATTAIEAYREMKLSWGVSMIDTGNARQYGVQPDQIGPFVDYATRRDAANKRSR